MVRWPRLVGLATAVAALCGAAPLRADERPSQDLLLTIGDIKPRTSTEARAAGGLARFSIGIETIERNYASYAEVAPYVDGLGADSARLMSGWANIEKQRGRYDFRDIDAAVDDLRRKGVTPWVSLTYGNPAVYGEVSGRVSLGSPLPEPGPAREAWLRFVDRTVAHLGRDGRVVEWEIWNEPDPRIAPEAYAEFAVQTVNRIMALQPKAVINLGAFTTASLTAPGTPGAAYVRTVLERFNAGAKVPPSQVKVTYHPYYPNPDASYGPNFQAFRATVERYGYRLRQGENGAPSAFQQNFALKDLEWTEDGQAKYALRRMLGDFVRGVDTGIFTMVDLHYPPGAAHRLPEGVWAKNSKGLLESGPYHGREPQFGDHRVLRPKAAYKAVRNLNTVFDRRVQVQPDAGCSVPAGYTVHAFTRVGEDGAARRMVAVWRHTDRPGENARAEPIDLACRNLPLGKARSDGALDAVQAANLLTGLVYRVRPESGALRRSGSGFELRGLPVSDTPLLVADDGFVPQQ